ncbi:hypothetical protein [Sporolactobacillus pectinivorans]|uniref:hypothetical protein n=1 Tax=Sporolactobacillus pectinivorans TaxID=1591408 RepID=UPI0012FE708E|nr:hypothetical protein [Sporolactobacillus pectinivorans]
MTPKRKKFYYYATAALFAAIGILQTVDDNAFAVLFYFCAIVLLSRAMRSKNE